jgi:hypothetical protein
MNKHDLQRGTWVWSFGGKYVQHNDGMTSYLTTSMPQVHCYCITLPVNSRRTQSRLHAHVPVHAMKRP